MSERVLAPPGRRLCDVVANRRSDGYRIFSALDREGPEAAHALSLLADRYPDFAARGAVLAVDVRRWSGWAASAATEES